MLHAISHCDRKASRPRHEVNTSYRSHYNFKSLKKKNVIVIQRVKT